MLSSVNFCNLYEKKKQSVSNDQQWPHEIRLEEEEE